MTTQWRNLGGNAISSAVFPDFALTATISRKSVGVRGHFSTVGIFRIFARDGCLGEKIFFYSLWIERDEKFDVVGDPIHGNAG